MVNQSFFKIREAEKLLSRYVQNREKAKARFLASLISCHYAFFAFDTTIVGQKLELFNLFRRKTAEAVLQELGYKIVIFSSKRKHLTDQFKLERVSVICFTDA